MRSMTPLRSSLLSETDAAFRFLKPRMLEKCVEVIPALDHYKVGFAEGAGLFESVEGEIDFAKTHLSDYEGDLGNVPTLQKLFELCQAHESLVALTGPGVRIRPRPVLQPNASLEC